MNSRNIVNVIPFNDINMPMNDAIVPNRHITNAAIIVFIRCPPNHILSSWLIL